MASNDSLLYFDPRSATLPATAYAQHDVIAGASTPAENFPVLAFDASATEYADFRGRLPASYAGGGLTVSVASSCGTTTGGVRWEAAIRRLNDDAEDLDSTAHTYDYNGVTVSSLASAVGELTYDAITFTSGADMDSLAAGEEFVLRVRRKHDDAGDTAAADAFLHGLSVSET